MAMKRRVTGDPGARIVDKDGETSVVRDALSHPLRVRILGWLRHQPARTQSEVGQALGISNATARYHLKALEGADLVRLRGTRPGPNGITEKLYAHNPDVWKRISGVPDRAEKLDFMLDYTFASIHEIHRKAVAMIKADWRPAFLAGSAGAFATPDEARALMRELDALLTGFYQKHHDPESPGAVPLAITYAVLPSSAEDAEGWAGERVFEWSGDAECEGRGA
jgi:DNA-binding transcriptional ArsR family regulator